MDDAVVIRSITEQYCRPIDAFHRMSRFLHRNQLGPPMVAFLSNGICMQHVKGTMLKWNDWPRLLEPNIWK